MGFNGVTYLGRRNGEVDDGIERECRFRVEKDAIDTTAELAPDFS